MVVRSRWCLALPCINITRRCGQHVVCCHNCIVDSVTRPRIDVIIPQWIEDSTKNEYLGFIKSSSCLSSSGRIQQHLYRLSLFLLKPHCSYLQLAQFCPFRPSVLSCVLLIVFLCHSRRYLPPSSTAPPTQRLPLLNDLHQQRNIVVFSSFSKNDETHYLPTFFS